VAEIAADFMTSYYGIQVGALESQEFRTTPVQFWLVCLSDTVKGPLRQIFFIVVLPDGKVVEPSVSKRLSLSESRMGNRGKRQAHFCEFSARYSVYCNY
jgi:hypothetical protein